MLEPVALKDFFATFFTSALIILAGASYALLFAWSKVNHNPWIQYFAYTAYVLLVIAVGLLSQYANFTGHWLILSSVMVIGYFFAPIGIWHLCVRTHPSHPTTSIRNHNE